MMRTTGGFSRPFTPVQPVAAAFAVAFLLVGALGFVPGVTSGELAVLPGGGTAVLAGLLPVSVLQNVLHLVTGLAGLVCARSRVASRVVLAAGGVVALLSAAVAPDVVGAALVVVAVAMIGCATLLRGRPVVRPPRRGAAAA
ncbi:MULTISPECIES: DUF4383 domain-containing protein [unclassified Pseudonocardia]|uniref:DUF4383 domain-containing protein n=1 Tax=unclassified Pseudonocardia TaxID=2619320 RepID=UPI0002F0303A|nr:MULTISPECIES: DUF4383 domain-containing protein [unclassified Pseudonocardia]